MDEDKTVVSEYTHDHGVGLPIQYTFPDTMEMLNKIIDERIAYKIKQLMRKGNRL